MSLPQTPSFSNNNYVCKKNCPVRLDHLSMIDNLEGPQRVVQVPVPWGVSTLREAENSFDYFTYAWATAVRGWHPLSKDFPWEQEYSTGEHPDLSQVFPTWEKPDTIPDLTCFGGNEDGFIQFGEAFNYARYLDGQTQVS